MSESVGYVVVCFNQASHQPDVMHASFTVERDQAEITADVERDMTASVGRRETYAVAEVVLDEEPS